MKSLTEELPELLLPSERPLRPETLGGGPPPAKADRTMAMSFVLGHREVTNGRQPGERSEPGGRSRAAPVAGSTAYPRPPPGPVPGGFGPTGFGRASSSRRSRFASRPTYTKKEPKPTRRSGVTSTPQATSTIPHATETARRLAPKPMHNHPPIEKTRSRSMRRLWICSRDQDTRKVPRPSVDPAIAIKRECKVARNVGQGAERSSGSRYAPGPAGRMPPPGGRRGLRGLARPSPDPPGPPSTGASHRENNGRRSGGHYRARTSGCPP
jgi:hypothetical protein